MNLGNFKPALVSIPAAVISSLCCLLPLTVVLLGLGSGAFMVVTMQYRTIFLPIGVIGVGLGYYFYFRERRRCHSIGCAFAGGKVNLVFLAIGTVMIVAALILDLFPELTSEILQGAM